MNMLRKAVVPLGVVAGLLGAIWFSTVVAALGKPSGGVYSDPINKARESKDRETREWMSSLKDYPPREAYESTCKSGGNKDECLMAWRSARAAEVQARAAVDQVWWARAGSLLVFATLVVTGFAAVFARQAARATHVSAQHARRSADIAERSLIATLGASVIVRNFRDSPVVDKASNVAAWRFWVEWENIGATQTKDMQAIINGTASGKALPEDYDFGPPPKPPGRGVIGPRTAINSGTLTIPAKLIEDMLAGKAFYYLWGWCEYGLMIPDTPRYRVDFRMRVVFDGDPLNKLGSVTFELHGGQQGQRQVS